MQDFNSRSQPRWMANDQVYYSVTLTLISKHYLLFILKHFQGSLTNYSWFSRQDASGTKIERPWGILFSIIRDIACVLGCVGNVYNPRKEMLEFSFNSMKTSKVFLFLFLASEKFDVLDLPHPTHFGTTSGLMCAQSHNFKPVFVHLRLGQHLLTQHYRVIIF